jgi:c-di-GMP-related signal transduction protein
METIIARQPIFNSKKRLFAYELLYRGQEKLSIANVGGDRATTSLLTSSFFTEGLEKISSNRPCFINFTEELLLQDIAGSFPKNKIVIEILEDVRPTSDILDACMNLKNQGYVIALDDFVYDESLIPLIKLADIIKFDFRLTPIDEIAQTLPRLKDYDIELLAEKLETYGEFEEALQLGFSYFQGYFFAEPEVMRIKELTTSRISILNLMAEINRKAISPTKMTEIISADVSLSYRLLRYINSAYFYLINEVESIAHAVNYLGEDEIRRFVTLVAISAISSDKPLELVKLVAVRAKFCELLGMESGVKTSPNELFLLGLFSLLPAMLDTTIENVLIKLPVSNDIKLALSKKAGPLSIFLEAVITYEKNDREHCLQALRVIHVPEEKAFGIYIASVEFAELFVNL